MNDHTSMAHQQFLRVIEGLLTPDNAVRRQAENAYNQFVSSSAEQSASLLLQLLQQAPDPQMRMLSAVLLRRRVNEPGKVAALSPGFKSTLMEASIKLVETEQQRGVRRNLCHLIAAFASSLGGTGLAGPANGSLAQSWPSLLPATLSYAQNTSQAGLKESGLYLLSILGEYCQLALRNAAQQVFACLGASYQSATGNGHMSAEAKALLVKSTTGFLLALQPEQLAAGAPLMEPMMNVLSSLLSSGDELEAREAMDGLVEMAVDQGVAKFMSASMVHLVMAMVQTARSTSFDTQTRILALEIICSLAENRPGLLRKMGADKTGAVVEVCINMAAELDGDGSANSGNSDWDMNTFQEMDDDEGQDSVSGMALEAIGRLGVKLGGRVVLPQAFAMIPRMIADEDWRKRRAGILALANISGGAVKMMKPELGKVLAMFLPRLQDPVQRVRFAAAMSVGLLCQAFNGEMQSKHHAAVVPALAQTLLPSAQSGSSPRVRGAAANSIITVFRGASEGTDADEFVDGDDNGMNASVGFPVAQYLQALMDGLVSILRESSNHFSVHEQAMDATAAVAGASGAAFGRFYDSFMPAAKGIVVNATGEDLRSLRGRTMQCIAKIGSAVGLAKFGPDAQQIMSTMLTQQQQQQASNGGAPVFDEDVAQACAQICRAIGESFAAYLPHVLPPLLGTLQKKNEFLVRNADEIVDAEAEMEAGLASQVINVPGMESKRITLNVNTVFEQKLALKCLYEYVNTLRDSPALLNFVLHIAEVAVPMATNRFSPEARSTAALLLPQLLSVACEQGAKTGGDLNVAATARKTATSLLAFIMPCYLQQLSEEVNREVLASVCEGICEIAKACFYSGGTDDATGSERAPVILVPLEHTRVICQAVCKNITEGAKRRVEMLEEARRENYDEEDMETLQEQLELEHEDMEMLVDAHGYLLKQHKANFLPVFNEISMACFQPLLADQMPVEIRWVAVCAYDDVIEHCGPQAAAQHLQTFVPPLLSAASSPDTMLRQAAVYGVRVVAENCQQQFSQLLSPALAVLMTLVTAADAREGENVGPTENAVAALSSIVKLYSKTHAAQVPAEKILPHWVGQLPLKEDEECAQMAHEHLVLFVEQNNPCLCSPQFSGKVRQIFQHILASENAGGGGGEDAVVLATPSVMARIRQQLQRMN